MSGKTTIEWTHMPGYVGGVWNPTTGCTRVSAGCDNCYAFALHDKRYKVNRDSAAANHVEGRDAPARARALGYGLPFPKQYDLPFSRVQLLEDRLDVPLRTKRPTCYFVDSMADLFHEDVPDEFLAKVWDVMGQCIWRHVFLVLTKRPERMQAWVSKRFGVGVTLAGASVMPYPNIWLGTSVEDQKAADERIPHLLATPAAIRFLSAEPLLGPIDLRMYLPLPMGGTTAKPDWVIVGGESGSRSRPMDLAWARSLVAQCRTAGVAPFVKQLGRGPVAQPAMYGHPSIQLALRDPKGGDFDEVGFPSDLRVREWPR